jgi:Flagellin hook IN motif
MNTISAASNSSSNLVNLLNNAAQGAGATASDGSTNVAPEMEAQSTDQVSLSDAAQTAAAADDSTGNPIDAAHYYNLVRWMNDKVNAYEHQVTSQIDQGKPVMPPGGTAAPATSANENSMASQTIADGFASIQAQIQQHVDKLGTKYQKQFATEQTKKLNSELTYFQKFAGKRIASQAKTQTAPPPPTQHQTNEVGDDVRWLNDRINAFEHQVTSDIDNRTAITPGKGADTNASADAQTYTATNVANGRGYTDGGGPVTLQIAGNKGSEQLTFATSTTLSSVATSIDNVTSATGVSATVSGSSLNLSPAGSAAGSFVSVKAIAGTFPLTPAGSEGDTGATMSQIIANGFAGIESDILNHMGSAASLFPDQVQQMQQRLATELQRVQGFAARREARLPAAVAPGTSTAPAAPTKPASDTADTVVDH